MGYALAAHLVSLVSLAMALTLIARAAEQRRPTGSLVAWLFAIVLVPYVGVPLYLVFGGRKLQSRAAAKHRLRESPARAGPEASRLATMLCASGASAPTRGNEIELLTTGEIAFVAIVALIEAAQRSVEVSTLIFADDEAGAAIATVLARRSRKGVAVRVLIDALFKFRASRRLLTELRTAGVQIAWFMPIWSFWRRNANLRLHRKAVIVDGERAIVGGMNLAREYLGPTPLASRWRDLSLRVAGPAVTDIANVFTSDWQFATHETERVLGAVAGAPLAAQPPPAAQPPLAVPPARESPRVDGADSVQVVGSGPDVESDRIYDALLSCTFDARSRIWVSTPYFVPDEGLLRALVLAVRRGVDVRVLTPRRSNHLTADLAGASYLRALAREGGRVYSYVPRMLHAKVVLIDDDLAVLGSANMDMRSLFLDYELALVLGSVAHSTEIEAWFHDSFADSVGLTPAGRARTVLESLARLLAPLE
jgi:cardiolipin synthase